MNVAPRTLRGWAPAAAAVIVVDQLTKAWAVDELSDRNIDVFWTLRLNLSYNTGMAFSAGISALISSATKDTRVPVWADRRLRAASKSAAFTAKPVVACGTPAARLMLSYIALAMPVRRRRFSPPAVAGEGADAGAARGAAASMSSRSTRPLGPLPATVPRSTPCSRA